MFLFLYLLTEKRIYFVLLYIVRRRTGRVGTQGGPMWHRSSSRNLTSRQFLLANSKRNKKLKMSPLQSTKMEYPRALCFWVLRTSAVSMKMWTRQPSSRRSSEASRPRTSLSLGRAAASRATWWTKCPWAPNTERLSLFHNSSIDTRLDNAQATNSCSTT